MSIVFKPTETKIQLRVETKIHLGGETNRKLKGHTKSDERQKNKNG